MARTETVTVLFTDLVGSTELANRLGHDAYEALRQEHFAACRAAVVTHHGSEIKTTGDGLMLCFSSTADAVACAIALQQAAEQQGRQAQRPAATNYSASSSSSGVVGGRRPCLPSFAPARRCLCGRGDARQ